MGEQLCLIEYISGRLLAQLLSVDVHGVTVLTGSSLHFLMCVPSVASYQNYEKSSIIKPHLTSSPKNSHPR